MKIEIKPKDRIMLLIASSALIIVLMFRLAIFPAMDAYEIKKIEYEEMQMQARQMQQLLDDQPANEQRIADGMARLDDLSNNCYVFMENRQVDELVTGVALAHHLFPSYLSISTSQAGVRTPYIYSSAAVSAVFENTENAEEATEAVAVTENAPVNDADDPESVEAASEYTGSVVLNVEASMAMSGAESDMKAFLNDIEENYPAIHIKSFEMAENLYMNTELEPVSEIQMSVVLEIYMYSIPDGQ